jgi:rRNA maturation endonuclease Nob1
MDEAQKQLNLEIKDGKVEFIDNKQCQFCNETITKEEIFCPKCGKCLE